MEMVNILNLKDLVRFIKQNNNNNIYKNICNEKKYK